jgi:hypothetical protein
VSCSGTLIGGAKQFRISLDTLLGHEPFWLNGRPALDQAYHNFLLHTGVFERNGVKAEFLDCNSHVLTMHYCSRGKKEVDGDRVVSPNRNVVPAVVHQYPLFGGRPECWTASAPEDGGFSQGLE